MQPSLFPIRGVIEGFYGPFYTFPERNDLIRFMSEHGYNLYVYGPKNDRQHRARWREAYPAEIMDQFAETAALGADSGVQFCYAISPLNYDPAVDYGILETKLRHFYERGIRSFSVLTDDFLCAEHHNPECAICPRPGVMHAELCNRLYTWLRSLDTTCTLSMCPGEYHGRPPWTRYLHDLGALLHPAIDMFYTGPDVCSSLIDAADVDAFAQAVRRKPIIWDNYPVNDLAMRSEMHIGPIRGREATLHEAVRGVVVNPMLQAEASKIPLLTFADYFRDQHGYAPWASWQRALQTMGGSANYAALLRFAEHSLDSCLGSEKPSTLEQLANDALAAVERGEHAATSPALRALREYLTVLDEACYELKYRMGNLRLRENLLPWVEALDEWVWIGKRTVQVLETLDDHKQHEFNTWSLKRALEKIEQQNKHSGGNALLPLAQHVLALVEQHTPQRHVEREQASQSMPAA